MTLVVDASVALAWWFPVERAVRRRCALDTPGNSLSYAAAAELVGFC